MGTAMTPEPATAPATATPERTAPTLSDLKDQPDLLTQLMQPTGDKTGEQSTEDSAGDEAPTGEEPPKEPEQFTVKVPLPPREGQQPADLELTLPTQEARDALTHTLKQAGRVPKLMERVSQAQGDTATVQFLEEHPLEGLMWIAQEKPEAGAQFLESWLRANPDAAAKAMEALGFKIEIDPANARALQAESSLARERAQTKVREGQQAFHQSLTQQQFRGVALDAIADMQTALGLADGSPDAEDFTDLATKRLARLYQEKGRGATPADIQQALEPVAQRFTPQTHHSASQPRVPAGQPVAGSFTKAPAEARADQQRQLRQLAPTNGATPAAVTKIPKGASLYTLRNIQQGKGG